MMTKDTDKIYRDIRVYRFKTLLLKHPPGLEFRSDGPIPIYSDDDKLLGFATSTEYGAYALLDCAIDPATPERLEMEIMSKPYWMDAVLEYRGFISSLKPGYVPTVAHVKALVLTSYEVPGQESIDLQLGALR
jgi:hypothetical protein